MLKLLYIKQKLRTNRSSRAPASRTILDLPADVLGHIFTLLSVDDHVACLQTCRSLEAIGNSLWIWRRKFSADFGLKEQDETEGLDWKQRYAVQHQFWASRPPRNMLISGPSSQSTKDLVYDTDLDGKSLVVYAYSNGVIGFRDLELSISGDVRMSCSAPMYTCTIDSDNNVVYCGTDEGKCLVLCTRSMTPLHSIEVLGHEDSVLRSLKCPLGIVLAGSRGGLSLVKNYKTSDVILMKHAHSAAINGLAYSVKHDMLVTSSCDGHVKLWRWSRSRSRLLCCRKHSLDFEHSDLSSLVVYEDFFLVGGHSDGTVRKYDLLNGHEIGRFSGHTRNVRTMHTDGRYLVTGSYDCTIRLWDIKTMKVLQIIGEGSVTPRWILSVCLKHRKIVYGTGSGCNLLEFR